MAGNLWHIEAAGARLNIARFSAIVRPNEPERGLVDIRVDGQPLTGLRPLCVELLGESNRPESAPDELYARGGDLVAGYVDLPQVAMRAEIYWRAGSHQLQGAIAAIELVASVQTSLPDSCPRIFTRSQIVADEVWRLANVERGAFVPIAAERERSSSPLEPGQAHCYLFRLAEAGLSYAEMVHPADVGDATSDRPAAPAQSPASGECAALELRHEFFAQRLEKGVILRARVLGILLERTGDARQAARHYAAFLSEKLPLTA